MLSRVWRLGYGPCWCQGVPPEGAPFDLTRFSVSPPSGQEGLNLLVVTDRVVGSPHLLKRLLDDIPPSRLVVSVGACTAASSFWDSLPDGWIPVDQLVNVDAHVDDCVNGHPESLVLAVLSLLGGRSDPKQVTEVRTRSRRIPHNLTHGGV